MKTYKILPFAFAGIFLITGCTDSTSLQNGDVSQKPQSTQAQVVNSNGAQIHVVTSFYPLAEIVKNVGGDYVEVKNLVPPGAEPHDFEPSPKDILALNNADLVVVNGVGFEPWAEKILPALEKKNVNVVDVSKVIPELLSPVEGSDEGDADESNGNEIVESKEGHEEEHFVFDPHFWLDPLAYISQVQVVNTALSTIDPTHKADFSQKADAYITQLQNLHSEYKNGLSSCKLKEIVTNHAAFAYLSKRYGLTMLPISGLSPDAEPSAKRLGELTELVKKDGVKIIFTESLMSPKVSETLAKETGVTTMVLNPLEGLTEDEIQAGENYISVMKKNLESLRTALECT